MARERRSAKLPAVIVKSRIPLPEYVPATAEELERRNKLYEQVMRRRARMEPLGISVDELIHQAREEADQIGGYRGELPEGARRSDKPSDGSRRVSQERRHCLAPKLA